MTADFSGLEKRLLDQEMELGRIFFIGFGSRGQPLMALLPVRFSLTFPNWGAQELRLKEDRYGLKVKGGQLVDAKWRLPVYAHSYWICNQLDVEYEYKLTDVLLHLPERRRLAVLPRSGQVLLENYKPCVLKKTGAEKL